jgi:tRNA modification GTPase
VNDGAMVRDAGERYGARALVIRNKGDLKAPPDEPDDLVTSAVTGQGLEALKQRVLEIAGVAQREGREDVSITTARQRGHAIAAGAAFGAACRARAERRVVEVVALDVRTAVRELAQLRGAEIGDRVLDEVFARFCIGK